MPAMSRFSAHFFAFFLLAFVFLGCAEGMSQSVAPHPDGGVPGAPSDRDAASPEGLDDGGDDAERPPEDSGADDSDDAEVDKPDAASAAPVCTAVNACETGRNLASVKGDDDAQSSAAMGVRSEWLSVAVNDTGNVFNADDTLKARITLESPADANFDLFVHLPSDAGGNATAIKDCSAPAVSSENEDGADVVTLSWEDVTNSPIGEAAGDSLTLAIEVRHIKGRCDAAWSLVVQGNTP